MITLRALRDRVRNKLRDFDQNRPAFDLFEYDTAICEAYLSVQGRLPAADLYTSSALTISAGSDTFSLSTTAPTSYTGNSAIAEYRPDIRIRLRSNGRFLERVSIANIDASRQGNPSVSLGVPWKFALWLDKSQVVQGRCYPGALASESCDLWQQLAASDLRNYVGSGSDDLDDVNVLMSDFGANALVSYAAADLVFRLTPEDLKERRLNPEVAKVWRGDAERDFLREEARIADMSETGELRDYVP